MSADRPAIVATLTDLENPERPPEEIVLRPRRHGEERGTWQQQEADWVEMLLHMAVVVLAWRRDDVEKAEPAATLARDIARCAADRNGGMPSLYGAGITLVVTRKHLPAEVAA
jgi:hypothetical protein